MSDAEYHTWLLSLTEGDKVVIRDASYNRTLTVSTVMRVTATQVIVKTSYGSSGRYRRATGRMVGEHYGSSLLPPTDQNLASAQAAQNRTRFSSEVYRVSSLTDGEIAAMLDALYAHRAANPEEVKP